MAHKDKETRRAYNREYQKRYYAENPDKRAAFQAKKKIKTDRRRNWLYSVKLYYGCTDCGYRGDPRALQFDHLPEYEKKDQISNMMAGSLEAIVNEIAKCEVVCANCHHIRTHDRAVV